MQKLISFFIALFIGLSSVAQLTDEEVQKILVRQEDSCRKLLDENRNALDLIARALLEHETISGDEVTRLIQAANGDSKTESIEDAATVD